MSFADLVDIHCQTDKYTRFYKNLSPFSPILDLKYSNHENHKALIYQEPLLCCTLLMISSRYHVLPGSGGNSRAHFIHMRLWSHCEHLIKRLTFGQEKYSVAKSRTMGSIEGLLLMTEWHPRSLHFPPENDGWDASLGATNDDAYFSSKRNEEEHLIRWREEVFEPAKRSDRMSWMLLGLANTLAHELGVWDNNNNLDDCSEAAKSSQDSKVKVRRLLFVCINQLASRIGCTTLIPQANPQSIAYAPDQPGAERDRQALISDWIEITKILKTAKEMFFPSNAFTQDLLATVRYATFIEHFQPLLQRWHETFLASKSNDDLSKIGFQVLLVDYQYVRMYINSLAVQAIVDRLQRKDQGPSPATSHLDYDFLEIVSSQDYKYVQEVTSASREILQITVLLANAGALRYAPVRVFIRITSASIFLLKAISLGARNTELLKSLEVLDQCIQALRSSALDEIHLSSKYAMLIERHVARFRRNFRVQAKSLMAPTRPHTPFASSSNVQVNHAMDTAASGGPAHNTIDDLNKNRLGNNAYHEQSNHRQLEDLVFDDDWLAQPFGPSVAPFGIGAHQSASGFELDSLDFLWNLPP